MIDVRVGGKDVRARVAYERVRERKEETAEGRRGGASGTHAQGRDHDVEDLAAVHAVLVREDLVQALGGVREGSGDVRAFRLGGVPGHGRDGADGVERRFLGGRVRSVRDRRRARGRLRGRRAREVDRRVVLRERGHQRRRRRLRLTRRAGHDRAASSGVTKAVGDDSRSQTETADFWFLLVRPRSSARMNVADFCRRGKNVSRETLVTRPFSPATQTGAPRSARSHTRAHATTPRVRPAVRAEPRDPSRLSRASPGRSRGHGARVAGRAGRPRRRRGARRLPNQSAVPAGKRRGQRRGGHARARRGDDAGPGDGREA